MSSYRLMKKRRKPGREISGVKTGSALILVKRQNKIYSKVAAFINGTAAEALRLLIEASFNEFNMNLFNNSRLCVHDNYLLGAYSRSIKSYAAIIAYYNKVEESIHDPHSKSILRGIRTILYTRISEYKEMDIDSLYNDRDEYENKYLMAFSGAIEQMIKDGCPKLSIDINDNYFKDIWHITEKKAEEITENIKADVIRVFAANIYNIYMNNSAKAGSNCVKEQAGERIKNCFEQIKQEQDILGAIVKIQAPELEARNTEISVVRKILAMLREQDQKIAFDINHIESLYRQAEIGESESEDFYTFLGRVTAFINSKDILTEKKDEFICEYVFLLDDFDEGVRNYVNNKFSERMARVGTEILEERQKQAIEGTQLLAAKVIGEFKNAVKEIDVNAYKEDEISNRIIQGINETLSIKVQSMGEMLGEYYESVKPYLEKRFCINNLYAKAAREADIEKQLNKYKSNNSGWLEDMKTSSKVLDNFLKETYLSVKNKGLLVAKKSIDSDRVNVARIDSRFKKECIFFEIITFEEIINYSISKLAQSESCAVTDYAEIVKACDDSIKEYMQSVGIEIISPESRDMFNGKIHEVLMVKEEDGFSKGKIIKVVNNGYREGGVIYARANVICAK